MAHFYRLGNAQVSYAVDGGHDIGFTPRGYRIVLHSGGPVSYSFDGVTDAGVLGRKKNKQNNTENCVGGGKRVRFPQGV